MVINSPKFEGTTWQILIVSLFLSQRYSLMLSCWDHIAKKRPAFEELVKYLSSKLVLVSDYLDLSSVPVESEYLKAD